LFPIGTGKGQSSSGKAGKKEVKERKEVGKKVQEE